MPVKRDIKLRLWEKVDRIGPTPPGFSSPCWMWTACKSKDGYGQISERHGRMRGAHRVAWELSTGQSIPPDKEIDHLCRNRACVNPAHLEPVTKKENTLRGESFSAQYARRSHCKHGHLLVAENVSVYRGARYCLVCRRRRYHERATARVALRVDMSELVEPPRSEA